MKRFDQINMIPFIDIMLVLLAIVLTTATFVSQGLIPVELPAAQQSQAVSEAAPPLEIAITAENRIFWQGQAVTAVELGRALDSHANTTPVRLRIDKAAAFEHFIAVVDVLKARHFEQVAIQTLQTP